MTPPNKRRLYFEAANIHPYPTPELGDSDWIYGHSWVRFAIALGHPMFGVIASPLLSFLYVRKLAIDAINARHGWKFRTKHEMALDFCRLVMRTLTDLKSKDGFVIVLDGAYSASALIRPPIAEGTTVMTGFRGDAKLPDLPVGTPGRRVRPCKFGNNRISLKRRAADRRGWQSIAYACRGVLA